MWVRQFIDKTNWPKGPWLTEPDHVMWINDDSGGYRCVMRRNLIGAWCGFVGIPPTHTLYMVPHTDPSYCYVDVHGDVTFSGFKDMESVLFSPPTKTWWVGFDAMQDTDLCPGAGSVIPVTKARRIKGKVSTIEQEYRDMEYIQNEVNFLAVQLAMFVEDYSD